MMDSLLCFSSKNVVVVLKSRESNLQKYAFEEAFFLRILIAKNEEEEENDERRR